MSHQELPLGPMAAEEQEKPVQPGTDLEVGDPEHASAEEVEVAWAEALTPEDPEAFYAGCEQR